MVHVVSRLSDQFQLAIFHPIPTSLVVTSKTDCSVTSPLPLHLLTRAQVNGDLDVIGAVQGTPW